MKTLDLMQVPLLDVTDRFGRDFGRDFFFLCLKLFYPVKKVKNGKGGNFMKGEICVALPK